MKKLTSILLVIVMLLSLIACNKEGETSTSPNDSWDEDNTGSYDVLQPSGEQTDPTNPSKTDKTALDVQITDADDFKDGYAIVEISRQYMAIIDTEGVIHYQHEYKDDDIYGMYATNLGNGYFVFDNEIITFYGETVASPFNGTYDEIVATGDGEVLVCKEKISGISRKYCYAAMNPNGEIASQWTESDDHLTNGWSVGDGVYRLYASDYTAADFQLLSTSEKMFFVWETYEYENEENEEVKEEIRWFPRDTSITTFRDGYAYIVKDDGEYYDENTDEWYYHHYYLAKLGIDGSISDITFLADNLNCNLYQKYPVIYETHEVNWDYICTEIKIYTPDKIISYTEYANNVEYVECFGDYIALRFDTNVFIVLDENGKQLYAPVSFDEYVSFYEDCIVVDGNSLVDTKTGDVIAENLTDYEICGDFSEGLAIARVCIDTWRDKYVYSYINAKGEVVIDKLYRQN